MSAAYLDASALVKLFKWEPESGPLLAALDEHEHQASSELIVVEALCTAKRLRDPKSVERAALALDRVGLIPFDEGIRNRASATRFDPPLRALGAIHLASALALEQDIDILLAYDRDLCEAARNEGIEVASPA